MRVVEVTLNTGRPGGKVYVAGHHRCHHGMAGLALTTAAIVSLHRTDAPWVAMAALGIGAALMWHDRHDFPWTADRDALFR
jgi:hypothetical protein